MDIQVAFLPSMFDRASLKNRVAVVIDVLRATTTIVEALAAGATAVVPCGEIPIDEVLDLKRRQSRILTGGERHGKLIEGFDLDNSPFSYTAEKVGGRVIAFTTTNGTRAVAAASAAKRVLIASFLNRRAIVEELRRARDPVTIVCAGTDGHVTAEDVLVAGAIVRELTETGPSETAWNVDQVEAVNSIELKQGVQVAASFARDWSQTHELRVDAMSRSRGGRNLIEIGQERDIHRAADDSVIDLVPEWDRFTGRITAGREVENGERPV